ncbi:large ribosomal subunit protein mL54-like [Asterias amurensis]|uniref:large ribosomal subunit protein mL54-like n=1 Tax=Asterias amurensis TaxID=7602 RepID=UPI003AB428AF
MATSMNKFCTFMRQQVISKTTLFPSISQRTCLPYQHPAGQGVVFKIQAATFAKKAGRGRSVEPKELMEVNTDAEYLVSHCSGSNYFKEGQDVKLGPDEDYPDWLWDLHIGPPLKLEEMSQDSPQYWRKLREMHMKRNNRLAKVKKF